jgi:hypothetical protein
MQGMDRSSPAGASDWRRQIFSVVNSGIAVYRAVDCGGDFVFVDLNPAAEMIEQVGRAQVCGRRVTEAFPGVADFGLLEVMARVWRSGVPEAHPLSRYSDGRIAGWRENRVFRLPAGEVVAIYDDPAPDMAIEGARARLAALSAELSYRVENLHEPLEVRERPGRGRAANAPGELRRMNLEHFRHVLARTTDPSERARIGRMIAEERAKPDSAYPSDLGFR